MFAPARTEVRGRWSQAISTLLAFVGFSLSCIWLQSALPPIAVPIGGALLTAIWWLGLGWNGHGVLAGLARIAALGILGVVVYLAVAMFYLLGWSVPTPFHLVVLALLVLAWIPAIRRRLVIPVALPLGLSVVVCLSGWYREDGTLRCADYQRIVRQPGVSVLMPSTPDIASCQGNDAVRPRRYPRRVWEAPDASRLIVGTQQGIEWFRPEGRRVETNFDGVICKVDPDGQTKPECFGDGKVQVFFEYPPRDSVLIPAWGQNDPALHGRLFEVPVHGPWKVLREHNFADDVGEGYIDVNADLAVMIRDGGERITLAHPSTLADAGQIPFDAMPLSTLYDPTTQDGVFCAGGLPGTDSDGLAVAFHGTPPHFRAIGHSLAAPWTYFAVPEGCTWAEADGKVYASVANFGVLAELDYRTGRILRTWYLGLGIRDAEYDARRHHVYVANFLRGDVSDIDLVSGRLTRTWFVGHFVRYLTLSRDGASLFAASTAGIVKIGL